MTDACQLWQWLLLSGKSERNFVFWLRTTSHHDILSETSPLSPRSSHTLIFDNTVSHKSVRAVAELQSQPTLAVSACLITKNKYDWMMLCIRTDNTTLQCLLIIKGTRLWWNWSPEYATSWLSATLLVNIHDRDEHRDNLMCNNYTSSFGHWNQGLKVLLFSKHHYAMKLSMILILECYRWWISSIV